MAAIPRAPAPLEPPEEEVVFAADPASLPVARPLQQVRPATEDVQPVLSLSAPNAMRPRFHRVLLRWALLVLIAIVAGITGGIVAGGG